MSTDFSAAAATATGRSRAGGPRPGLALVLIATAQLMVYLDTTIVNMARPHIQRAFNFSGSGLEWVVNADAVSFGGLLLLGGRAGDRLGRKKVFVGGTSLFATASLARGLADSQAWLLTAGAVQGLGAALIAPATLSLVNTTFAAGAQRTRATAVYVAIQRIVPSLDACYEPWTMLGHLAARCRLSRQPGADTAVIEAFLDLVRRGEPVRRLPAPPHPGG